ncbi:hypothetical protein BAU01nite_17660 [Brevibacterium aurantiacum]|nr:hypothetical protein BAU01nite_17660 [Brevibacterium aurantiacum]
MALAQEGDEHAGDCFVLADDGLGDLRAHIDECLAQRVAFLGRLLWGLHRLSLLGLRRLLRLFL